MVVAIDGCDLELARAWMSEGRLPTLAGVVAEGCWGTTTGPEHVCEHGSWVSAFSGTSRREHGYFAYRQLEPGTYSIRPYTPRDAQATPCWALLRGTGRRVAVLDAPEVTPVRGLDGVQLANWATHQPDMAVLPPEAEPATLLDDARRIFGGNENISEFETNSSVTADLDVHRRLLERVERRGALYRELVARADPDLAVLGFFEAHKASHRFWDYRRDATGDLARRDERLQDAIRDVYEATDRVLASVLAAFGRPANVVVVSTFGMKDEYPTWGLMDSFMRSLGYQPHLAAGGSSSGPLALARRLVPRPVREALSRRLPPAVQERALADAFRHSTDWGAATAFATPSLFTSFVRVNLRGREPEGIVTPGAEYDRLLDRLEADLHALVDPFDGRPAVQEVTRTVDVLGGGPPHALPDLFVEWSATTRLRRTLEHPQATLTQTPPAYLRGNEHTHHGLLAACGPSVRARGWIGDVSILDLAPTFLALLGADVPDHLEGSVLPLAGAR